MSNKPDFILRTMESPRTRKVEVMQVICVESQIGNGDDTPLRPFLEYFDMEGRPLEFGDWTQKESP